MLTLRAAAELIGNTSRPEDVGPLLAALDFQSQPLLLDAQIISELGLPGDVVSASISTGDGALRALCVQLSESRSIRESGTDIARALARNAPHLLWLILLLLPRQSRCSIIAFNPWMDSFRLCVLDVDLRNIRDSDAETVCALAAAGGRTDVEQHARWLEVLGRRSLSRRFYRQLERSIVLMENSPSVAPSEARREIALLNVSRLLFLAFLQAKGWLDGDRDFLVRLFEDSMRRGGCFERRTLRALFFGTLNTRASLRSPVARAFGKVPFLNGGLFARTNVEKKWTRHEFSDEHYGALYETLFTRYRFTAREDSTAWSDAAVDPEMLGHAFESLMESSDRKSSGAFYTPNVVVEQLAGDALGQWISLDQLRTLRVIDPACGSGAFLVHMLERIAQLRRERGDDLSITKARAAVLVDSIHGVDINPTAVWLCQLRLWLSVVIDDDTCDPMRVLPLPNLDRNIRVGDALSGDVGNAGRVMESRAVATRRVRYARASGARKTSLLRQLEKEERRLAISILEQQKLRLDTQRSELIRSMRALNLWGERQAAANRDRQELASLKARSRAASTSLRRLRNGGALPFSFPTHFPHAGDGFDIVIGNPPWVRAHRIPEIQRAELRQRFTVHRDSAWRHGAELANAGRGFGGQVDLSALFVERALQLLSPRGCMALLLPCKLLRTLAGGGVRRLLAEQSELRVIHEYSEGASLFDAAVYPLSLVATRTGAVAPAGTCIMVHRGSRVHRWNAAQGELPYDDSPGSPILLMPPAVRRAFDDIRDAGVPLARSSLGTPQLGVKTGCNAAFVGNELIAALPASLVRPVLRGEDIREWQSSPGGQMIWTHGDDGQPLAHPDPRVLRAIAPWQRELMARTDLAGRAEWWSLFRTEAACSRGYRVVWSDFARTPRALVLPPGDRTVPLNTCYVLPCASEVDANAFCALLNSPIVASWLAQVAEPARGGYRRYLGWTMALLPVPQRWGDVRGELAGLTRSALSGQAPESVELVEQVATAYGLEARQLVPLMEWST